MPVIKKVNLYSSNDLKANLDENLFSVFEALGYSEDFTLIDVRLGLGVVLVAIAGATFYIDKKMQFTDSINIVAGLVAAYFILSFALWIWTKFVEKTVKFVGYKGKEKLIAKTALETVADEPVYHIELALNDGQSVSANIKYTELYNENGFLVYVEFKTFLKKELSKISKKSL